MNTFNTNSRSDDQLKELLFRQLFDLQLQLKQFNDLKLDSLEKDVNQVMEKIDQMMQTILDSILKQS